MSIYAKLVRVQSAIKAPKSQVNKFGGYSYRSLEDICEAAKPLLAKEKLALIMRDEPMVVDGWHYIKATAVLFDAETGEYVENWAFAREPIDKKGSDASQITGATSSYARKYALNALFAIDDTKDADGHDNREPTPKQTPVTLAQVMAAFDKAFDNRSIKELDAAAKTLASELQSSEDRDKARQSYIDLKGSLKEAT